MPKDAWKDWPALPGRESDGSVTLLQYAAIQIAAGHQCNGDAAVRSAHEVLDALERDQTRRYTEAQERERAEDSVHDA